MKILIITQHFHPENFRFNDLALGLTERGHDVEVLTGIPNYPGGHFFKGYSLLKPRIETWKGIKITRAPLWPRQNNKFSLALNYISFAFFGSIWSMKFVFKKYDSYFVCQSSPIYMAVPAVFLRIFTGTKTFLWITDLWPESLRATNTIKNTFILRMVEWSVKIIYQNVDHILIACKGFEKSIHDKSPHSKITYFPYWAEDFYHVTEKNSQFHFPSAFKVMFAGNLGVAQNLSVLIKAASKLKHLKDLRFIIVGEGRDKNRLLKEIETYQVSEFFIFLGSFSPEDMPPIYAHADVLFLSLRKDPIFEITVPSKLQSYMASGKMIIGSLDGESADLIKEAQCGLTASADDEVKLAQIIEKAYLMPETDRSILGSNALSYFQSYFKRAVQMEFIDNLLSQK